MTERAKPKVGDRLYVVFNYGINQPKWMAVSKVGYKYFRIASDDFDCLFDNTTWKAIGGRLLEAWQSEEEYRQSITDRQMRQKSFAKVKEALKNWVPKNEDQLQEMAKILGVEL